MLYFGVSPQVLRCERIPQVIAESIPQILLFKSIPLVLHFGNIPQVRLLELATQVFLFCEYFAASTFREYLIESTPWGRLIDSIAQVPLFGEYPESTTFQGYRAGTPL